MPRFARPESGGPCPDSRGAVSGGSGGQRALREPSAGDEVLCTHGLMGLGRADAAGGLPLFLENSDRHTGTPGGARARASGLFRPSINHVA